MADFTTAVDGIAAVAVVTVDVATLVRMTAEVEVPIETVVVVGPESDFESHVMGEFALLGRMLKLGLLRLPPWRIGSARLRWHA